MIDFQNISKSYFGEYILHDVSFRINHGEKIGIVGPNGAGKSTIFGIITGEVVPDSGKVAIPKNHRIGIMRQRILPEDLNRTLLEFTSDAIPEIKEYTAELHELEITMADETDDDKLSSQLKRHGELQSMIEHIGAYRLDMEAKQALSSLGFSVDSFDRKLSEFSGGWQMRAALARVLISHPDVLMLDEPSNYLDVPAVEWLCRFLNTFPGTLLLISHDRFLLRKLAKVTLEVNSGIVTRYAGGYDYYRTERENRFKSLEAAKRNNDLKKKQMERVIDRFKAKSTKAAQAKSWQKKLDKMEDIVIPGSINYQGSIRFPEPPPGGTEALRLEKLTFSYPEKENLFEDFSLSVDAGEKMAIIGFNGRGKTTLLKLIAGKLKPTNGRVVLGHHSVVGYQAQEFSELLNDELSVFDAVRQALPEGASTANLMNVLGSFGFSGDAVDKPCGVLSGGEKIRLQFARLFVNPPNLLILDEPTTHLDLAARELLQEALSSFKGTVLLVSHDIEFVRGTASVILAVEENGPKKYFGNYDYYLSKIAENQSANITKDITVNKKVTPEAPENNMLAKDRRRQRAQARQAISGKLREYKDKVAKLEEDLENFSNQKDVIMAKLSSGMNVDFAALKKELASLDKKIESTEIEWEETATELEALRLENARIND